MNVNRGLRSTNTEGVWLWLFLGSYFSRIYSHRTYFILNILMCKMLHNKTLNYFFNSGYTTSSSSLPTSAVHPCKHLLCGRLWGQHSDYVLVWEPRSRLLPRHSAGQWRSDDDLPGHDRGLLQCDWTRLRSGLPRVCGLLWRILRQPAHSCGRHTFRWDR